MIGGFEEPNAGTIYLGGRAVTGLPPYKRDVNTVFQSYALFPHLTVFENVAFGLSAAASRGPTYADASSKSSRSSGFRAERPQAAAAVRRPAAAGGACAGARQQPQVLLLDEPLGALDLKLRKQMQLELKMSSTTSPSLSSTSRTTRRRR